MRAVFLESMIDSCTILRQGLSRTTGGGEDNTFTPVSGATGVSCRVAPSARLPKEVSAQETTLSEDVWIIHVPASTGPTDPTNFTAADRVQVTILATGNVMTFEILAVFPDRTWALERRAYLKLVN